MFSFLFCSSTDEEDEGDNTLEAKKYLVFRQNQHIRSVLGHPGRSLLVHMVA